MNESWLKDAYNHANNCNPEESCGLLLDVNGKKIYWKCKNISKSYKENSFVIDPIDWANGEDQGLVLGIVHSHPNGILKFSETDKKSCKFNNLPFYLVVPQSESMISMRPEDL